MSGIIIYPQYPKEDQALIEYEDVPISDKEINEYYLRLMLSEVSVDLDLPQEGPSNDYNEDDNEVPPVIRHLCKRYSDIELGLNEIDDQLLIVMFDFGQRMGIGKLIVGSDKGASINISSRQSSSIKTAELDPDEAEYLNAETREVPLYGMIIPAYYKNCYVPGQYLMFCVDGYMSLVRANKEKDHKLRENPIPIVLSEVEDGIGLCTTILKGNYPDITGNFTTVISTDLPGVTEEELEMLNDIFVGSLLILRDLHLAASLTREDLAKKRDRRMDELYDYFDEPENKSNKDENETDL